MKQIVTMSVATMLLAASCTNVNVNNANDDFRDSHKWGKVIRQEVVVSDFTSIELSEDFDVVYRQSDEPSAFIEGNEKVVAYHHIEVTNGVLVDHKTDDAPMNMPPVRIVVSSPQLKSIELSGSGDVDIKDSVALGDLSLLLSGSGDIDIEYLDCSSVKAIVSGSGDIKIDHVECEGDAVCDLTGSGDINVDVVSDNVNVTVSGSGDADLTVDCDVINAKATGTGNMKLVGTAKVLNKHSSGLASIDTKKLEVEQINLK